MLSPDVAAWFVGIGSLVLGISMTVTKLREQKEAEKAEQRRIENLRYAQRIIDEQEERERQEEMDRINEELDGLYRKLDLITELQDMYKDAPRTEENLRKAIENENDLQRVNKQIHALERKLDNI